MTNSQSLYIFLILILEIDNTAILLPYKVKSESSNQYWWYNENDIELIERKGE